ncbi:MAG: hypothetical protein RR838_01590 [Clostridium sp.]
MEAKVFNLEKSNIELINRALYEKKNYMFYDDFEDEEGNEAYKFFYSSANDPLEFINIDIYKSNISLCGKIHITTDRDITINNKNSKYGDINLISVKIRNKDKRRVEFALSQYGYNNIFEAIKYFEELL